MFWGMRIRGTDLSDIEPFQLAAEAIADKVISPTYLTIAAAGVRVEGDDQFLILASGGSGTLLDNCVAFTSRAKGVYQV